MSKALVAWGARGVESVRLCQKLPPHATESIPASSEMDWPLSKAEPISDRGSISGKRYSERSKNSPTVKTVFKK